MADGVSQEDFTKLLQAVSAIQASLKALKSQVDGIDEEQTADSKNMVEHIKGNQSDFMKVGQLTDKFEKRIAELEKKKK